MKVYGVEIPEWAILGSTAAALGYWYATRNHRYFKSVGIPGPTPLPFIGSIGMYTSGKPLFEADQDMRKEYGNVFGVCEGSLLNLFVYDPDLIKELFIKNFNSFTNRRAFLIGGPMDSAITTLTDEHWKYVRSSLSPTFTQGKLKMMMPHIQRCADIFVKVVGDQDGDSDVDVRKRVYGYTCDVIATTAFGLDTDAQTNPECQFTKQARIMIGAFENFETLMEKIQYAFTIISFILLPEWFIQFLYNWFGLSIMPTSTLKYYEGLVRAALKDRMDTSEPGHDFVQTMADSVHEATRKDPDTLYDEKGLAWSRKGLTTDEIIGNAMIFIMAGFQTTADTLLYLFYELAWNPEIQQKLYEEIEENCHSDELTTDQINKLKYLECCVNEALRLYPQGFRFDREAKEDITVNGLKIKKGMIVTISNYGIHRDPEYWPNPDQFEPERFLPENSANRNPSAFLPFGLGNRSCIGNRLALLEMKAVVVQVVKSFIIEKCDKTPAKPIKFKPVAAMAPEETIYLKFTKRAG